jgi:hypothetical protein
METTLEIICLQYSNSFSKRNTQDPKTKIFAGTDNGLYASINQGVSWETFQNEMCSHTRPSHTNCEAKHLRHPFGRGIYTSNIAPCSS